MRRAFHATNEPDTCLWCGHKLAKYQYGDGRGYNGKGVFCSLSCGYQFAIHAVKLGFRFPPMPDPPAVRPRRPPDKTPKCPLCKTPMKVHYGTFDDFYLFCPNRECSDNHNWHPACKDDQGSWVFIEEPVHESPGGDGQ